LIDYNHALISGLIGGVSFFFSIVGWAWPVVIAVFVLKVVVPHISAGRERRRLSGIGISDVDSLDGKRFEVYLEVRFRERGYRVERTPYQGDWGADLILEKDGTRTAVQAKRWKKNVGVGAVQEATAAKGKYRCDRATVVTNSRFTKAARELAAANTVELWDRDKLIRELMEIRPEDMKVAAVGVGVGTTGAAVIDEVLEVEKRPTPKAVRFVSGNVADEGQAVCAVCGKGLSPKVEAFCRGNAGRFGGRMLCFEHQKK